jgi:hypothetical protein
MVPPDVLKVRGLPPYILYPKRTPVGDHAEIIVLSTLVLSLTGTQYHTYKTILTVLLAALPFPKSI